MAEMKVLGFVARPHFAAVREKDKSYIELIGIALAQRFALRSD